MAVRAMLLILGSFHLLTGIWMLAAPMGWYMAVPGVSASGPLNHHFIADIGLVFLASGAGLILGARRGPRAAVWAVAGAALHALLHIWGWFATASPRPAPSSLQKSWAWSA